MRLCDRLMREQGRALALLRVWLRSSTREHARRCARSAAPYGSRRAYPWELARHATDAASWLMGCIIVVGVVAGGLLNPYVSWWWGLALAFVAASLAPAWAETTVGDPVSFSLMT